MNKKTIALSLATVCVVTAVALSLEAVSRQQQLQQENRDLQQSQKELQNRLDALSEIGSKDEKLTDDKNATTEEPDTPSGYETYASDQNKISFSYPSDFKLEETTRTTYRDGKSWNKILLSRESATHQTELLIETNADGYGPIFADKYYTLVGQADGTVKIESEETAPRTENNDDQWLTIVVTMPDDINDQRYAIRLDSQGDEAGNETILKNLIASIKIAK